MIKQTELKTFYDKVDGFRTIGADGIFGGLNAAGNININFYTETTDIPSDVTLLLDSENNREIGEKSRVNRKGIVRELGVGVNINLNTAKTIVVWLNDRIKEIENHPNFIRQKGG